MALQISLKKLSMAAVAAVAGTGGVGLSYRVAHAEQGKEPPEEKLSNPYPRTTAAGFDPEALERGAKVLREINQSKYAKQVCKKPSSSIECSPWCERRPENQVYK
jgi:hypothetical protein